MKNTFKFEFHILYYIVAFICMLTGYFKSFIWISLLIIIHECGHVTGAILCNWKIEKVVIMPFGGMTILKENLNKPLYQEWIIVLLGPLYQMAFYFFLLMFQKVNIEFRLYHYILLGFNLLPMIPLDGSKMLGLILETFFPYRKAKTIEFYFSIVFVFLLSGYCLMQRNILLGIILIFIWIENLKYWKKIPYYFEKFLLERYLYEFSFSKCFKIKGLNLTKMKRGYRHLFFQNGRWQTENEALKNYFL